MYLLSAGRTLSLVAAAQCPWLESLTYEVDKAGPTLRRRSNQLQIGFAHRWVSPSLSVRPDIPFHPSSRDDDELSEPQDMGTQSRIGSQHRHSHEASFS